MHIRRKHSEQQGPAADSQEKQSRVTLTQECLFDILKEEKMKVQENSLYNEQLRANLKQCCDNDGTLWLNALDLNRVFNPPFKSLLLNEDAEKFYRHCYTEILSTQNSSCHNTLQKWLQLF